MPQAEIDSSLSYYTVYRVVLQRQCSISGLSVLEMKLLIKMSHKRHIFITLVTHMYEIGKKRRDYLSLRVKKQMIYHYFGTSLLNMYEFWVVL